MEIHFTKVNDRTYSTVAIRSDGVTVKIPSFDRPKGLPHDIAHFVVEE